jgi:hypothetical protein
MNDGFRIIETGEHRDFKACVQRIFRFRVVCDRCIAAHKIESIRSPDGFHVIGVLAGFGSLCELCGEDNGGYDMLCAFYR